MLSFSEFNNLQLQEAVVPRNHQGGFLGTAGDQAARLLDHAVALIKKNTKGITALKFDDTVIAHYLDSRFGRQVAEMLLDKIPDDQVSAYIKTSMRTFPRIYNADNFTLPPAAK